MMSAQTSVASRPRVGLPLARTAGALLLPLLLLACSSPITAPPPASTASAPSTTAAKVPTALPAVAAPSAPSARAPTGPAALPPTPLRPVPALTGPVTRCSTAQKLGECYRMRAKLIESLLDDLDDLALARDKRALPAAFDALETGEPDVQRKALRILGQFPGEPEVAQRALALLLEGNDYAVEGLAANVLRGSREPGPRRIAAQYLRGHGRAGAHPWDEGRSVADIGFEVYPGAAPYPPGESTHSLGFMTPASVAEVTAFYAKTAAARVLERNAVQPDWWALVRKRIAEDKRTKEELLLRKEHARTHDPALIKRATELRAEVAKESAAHTPPLMRGDTPVPGFGRDPILAQARWVVLDAKPPHPDRAALVYAEPALGKTVVVVGWSPPPPAQ